MDELMAALDLAIRQFPNFLFGILAFVYLAKQNAQALNAMREVNERQFELIRQLCADCGRSSRRPDVSG
ncbi:hypothetical protein VZO05_10825 [Aggregatilineales bacterium SYSU G02658]